MSIDEQIEERMKAAATSVGSLWPIHSFVTANPLAGFEDQPFEEGVAQAADLLGGRGYPSAETFRVALEQGHIQSEILDAELATAGYDDDHEMLLDQLADSGVTGGSTTTAAADRVDQVLSKWLSAFLDEGSAEWPMPNREAGFYAAFHAVVSYDGEIADREAITTLPATPTEAIKFLLRPYSPDQWESIFEEQLLALPGWAGLIKQRTDTGSPWQLSHPISMQGYVAARLALLRAFNIDIEPPSDTLGTNSTDELAVSFLRAWEATYRRELVENITAASQSMSDTSRSGRPDAQLVFCIDTRSEIIRRHVEAQGEYDTYGYAGFFGIPMQYQGYNATVSIDACPPILEPTHQIAAVPTDHQTQARHDKWQNLHDAVGAVRKTLEANAATAYGYVETAGGGYGLALAARTLAPGSIRNLISTVNNRIPDVHEFCEPLLDRQDSQLKNLPVGLSIEEQVNYAAAAFDLMGWNTFSRLVVFIGHASETANNPYDSSLDCGACAGNPGGPNARVIAAICNNPKVRSELRDRGFDIPEETVFLAGQHNTTTDEIDLYDSEIPESHTGELSQLRTDLAAARETAVIERVDSRDGEESIQAAERRAADWAEPRPEWGLAGNASFIIGPRELTSQYHLNGRAFLHSYQWSCDSDGDALESIMTGPMVVTQWINSQYYFSTVDNAVYGSGSKITQNPVGNIGVYQGNGGDLMTGLPLQSLMSADEEPYHQPLRLSTVIHAPVSRVNHILADHEELTQLLDNGWLSLTVVDPTQNHSAMHYQEDCNWEPLSERFRENPPASTVASAVDD